MRSDRAREEVVQDAKVERAVRVVLVDDHPVVSEGLRLLVNSEPDMEVVGEGSNGDEACRLASELKPDVIVMDLSMPGVDGAEATERVRRETPSVRVLGLTVHEERLYVTQLFRAGASGFVLKRTAAAELVRAVRVVAGGGTYIDPSIASTAVDHYIDDTTEDDAQHKALSEREQAVLVRVAIGFSNKEIAAALGLSVKTVETYKARAAEKLGLRTRVDIVRYAFRRGWLDSPTPNR